MEARAKAKYVRVSPRKTNQVLDLVRGQDVESAMQLLMFTPKHVARTVLKTLKSAVANAGAIDAGVNPEDLYVKECLCGPAPIMKRFLPRAQGRATPIMKRSCHITIVVGEKPVKNKLVVKAEVEEAPAKEASPAKKATKKKTAKKKTAAKKSAKSSLKEAKSG